jgi:hypothetical protein
MGWAQDLASLPLKALVNWGKPAPEVNYGAVTKRSEYGNPDDIVGNIGYDARNFVAGVGKTSPLLEPISKIPLVGPALAVTTGILGGAWSAATGGEEQRQNRQAEAEAAKIVRDKYLANEEFLNQTEREQLAKLNEYIKRLEQSYQNQLGLQAGLLARQMQANQQAYGSQLGSVGMGYAAAQPRMMRDLAARGMLGTGAEAVARGALAGQRAYDVAKAMQNFEAQNAKYYEADIGTRSDFLSRFNQGENQLTKARADLNTALREARLENQQGNVDAAAKLSQQFRKDAGESVQKRNEDIFQGAVNLVSSGAFQSAMGSAFGSLNNAAPEAVGEAWKPSGQGLSGAFRDISPAPAPTFGPTVNATADSFTGIVPGGTNVMPQLAITDDKLPSQFNAPSRQPLDNMATRQELTSPFTAVNPLSTMTMSNIPVDTAAQNRITQDAVVSGLGQYFREMLPDTPRTGIPFTTRRYDTAGNLIEENGVATNRVPVNQRRELPLRPLPVVPKETYGPIMPLPSTTYSAPKPPKTNQKIARSDYPLTYSG